MPFRAHGERHVTVPNDPWTDGSDHSIVQYLADPIYRARGWIRFLAVIGFIVGGMYAVTIVGLVFAWIPILLGVFLWQAAAAIEKGWAQRSAEHVHTAHDKLRLALMTYSIVMIVGFVLSLIFFGTVMSQFDELFDGIST